MRGDAKRSAKVADHKVKTKSSIVVSASVNCTVLHAKLFSPKKKNCVNKIKHKVTYAVLHNLKLIITVSQNTYY